MKNGLLIYGCYGYTGKLISELAAANGLPATLAGRNEARTRELATRLSLPYKVFDLNEADDIAGYLAPFKAVLHCAGPFIHTAGIMMDACLKAGTHYLDITGEYQVFEMAFKRDKDALKTNVLLMPGVGFDVVPSDCLALHLKEKLPSAEWLELAMLQQGGRLSHGTAITIAENAGESCMVRRKGKLAAVRNGSLTRIVEFDNKQKKGVAISWGDIATAYRSTQIPNITVYNCLPQKLIDGMKMTNYIGFILRAPLVKRYLIKKIKKRPAGPSQEERGKAKTFIWGEVKNALGVSKKAFVELPEGYTLTALTAVKISQCVLHNPPATGAKTPAQVFGSKFITQFEGVKLKDL